MKTIKFSRQVSNKVDRCCKIQGNFQILHTKYFNEKGNSLSIIKRNLLPFEDNYFTIHFLCSLAHAAL